MEEKRRHKRLALDASVQLERLDAEEEAALEELHVDVTDISRCGIGFTADRKLETGTYYNIRLQLWTKEVVETKVEIVRVEEQADGYRYGGEFIGLSDMDALRIDVYQIFNER